MGKFGTPRDGSRFLFDAMILSHHGVEEGETCELLTERAARGKVAHA